MNRKSAVDLVRRSTPPRYSRVSTWAVWTEPGGIVWALVWTRIALLLVLFGVVGGYAPAIHRGINYKMEQAKLTPSDVRHLKAGGAIADGTGAILIDPAVDHLVFVTIDQFGNVTEAGPVGTTADKVAVLQADGNASYESVISALDRIKQHWGAEAIWITATNGDVPSN